MRQFPALRLSIAIILVSTAFCQAEEPGPLVGTWKLVTARYNGREHTFPEGTTTLKHVTSTQFMWASYDKKGTITRAAGGSYSTDGKRYIETPEYGISNDFQIIREKEQKFEWKVEGDQWRHTGKLNNGLTIDEVWVRVRKR